MRGFGRTAHVDPIFLFCNQKSFTKVSGLTWCVFENFGYILF